MSLFRAIAWDIDGTLIDSEPLHQRALIAVSAALGVGKIIAFSLSLDDVSSGKPDPEPYLKAARRLGAEPHATVAVEDSGAGARSARAAGLYVVGYAPSGEAFVGADPSIAKLTEVAGLFEA
jgi:beta-phosphoglucomutase-like phosphatase (HAD superfamily)